MGISKLRRRERELLQPQWSRRWWASELEDGGLVGQVARSAQQVAGYGELQYSGSSAVTTAIRNSLFVTEAFSSMISSLLIVLLSCPRSVAQTQITRGIVSLLLLQLTVVAVATASGHDEPITSKVPALIVTPA